MQRKTFFTKTNIQMLTMSFVGLVIMIVLSLYVGASIHEHARSVTSVEAH